MFKFLKIKNMIQKNIKALLVILFLILTSINLNAQKVAKLFEKGEYSKAEEYCLKLKGEKQDRNYSELADEYLKLAEISYHSEAKEYYKKADTFYSKTKNSKDGYLKIADSYYNSKAYKNAANYYEKAYADNNEKLKESYNKIADVYVKQADTKKSYSYSEAEEKYDIAVEYFQKADNWEAIKKIGDVFFKIKFYEEADKYYQSASSVNEVYMKEIYNGIADDFDENKEYLKAADYYKKAGNYIRIEEIADFCVENYNYDRYKNAGRLYEMAFEKDTVKLNERYLKVADVAFRNRSYNSAAEFYEKAFADNTENLNKSYKKVADAFVKTKEYEKAAEYYGKAGLKKEEIKYRSYYSYVDKRNGKTYGILQVGNNVWMTENLAYKVNRGCWEYSKNSTYGYLYNWETAKNVCPEGWHLPTKEEFEQLIRFRGCDIYSFTSCAYEWLTGSLGIKLVLGGERTKNGKFENIKYVGMYWSSEDQYQYDDISHIFCLKVGEEFGYEGGTPYHETRKAGIVEIYGSDKGFSVRCVRD